MMSHLRRKDKPAHIKEVLYLASPSGWDLFIVPSSDSCPHAHLQSKPLTPSVRTRALPPQWPRVSAYPSVSPEEKQKRRGNGFLTNLRGTHRTVTQIGSLATHSISAPWLSKEGITFSHSAAGTFTKASSVLISNHPAFLFGDARLSLPAGWTWWCPSGLWPGFQAWSLACAPTAFSTIQRLTCACERRLLEQFYFIGSTWPKAISELWEGKKGKRSNPFGAAL